MVTKHLNVEHLSSKVESRPPVLTSWQSAGRLVYSINCGKWLDEGTVPHRVGAPDPNVLPKRNIGICCKSENIGDCSDDMCNGGMAELLTLHSSMDNLPVYGAIESTPHTTGLIRQQVMR